jgi:hypothetical protein
VLTFWLGVVVLIILTLAWPAAISFALARFLPKIPDWIIFTGAWLSLPGLLMCLLAWVRWAALTHKLPNAADEGWMYILAFSALLLILSIVTGWWTSSIGLKKAHQARSSDYL